MATDVHISVARQMLAKGEPVDLTVWKADGSIVTYHNCISLKYDHRAGVRNVKLLDSRQIRKVRDVLIYKINDLEVYL